MTSTVQAAAAARGRLCRPAARGVPVRLDHRRAQAPHDGADRRLESTPRGLYCGAIGWIDAPRAMTRAAATSACRSRSARSRWAPKRRGLRPPRLGVGAGIVLDSRADDEFDECRLKARFLTGLDPGFELFETMLRERRRGGVRHLERHLARLAHSARGARLRVRSRRGARRRVATPAALRARRPRRACAWRWRMTARCALTHAPLAPLPDGAGDAAGRRPQRLPDANPLAAHKTTLRAALRRRRACGRARRRLRQPVLQRRRPAGRRRPQLGVRAPRRPLVHAAAGRRRAARRDARRAARTTRPGPRASAA